MYQSPRSYQKAFSARHSEALRIVGTYRFMSPAAFAAQDHLAMSLAHHATVGDDTGRGGPRKGIVRCWLGAASGLNYARLAALKQTDDPTNRFRCNQHIAPAG